MVKLITEMTEEVQYIKEDNGGSYFIQGIFMQANKKNRNGRVYPLPLLQRECDRYIQNYISPNRALSELGHPDGPQINLERVSHMIKELVQDGDNFIGKAKILNTPYGKIVKDFIDEGVKLGVSTRGMGSLRNINGINQVQDDFNLVAIDIVADPSAAEAFVQGIMEGKEWIYENGTYLPCEIEQAQKTVKKTPKNDLEKTTLKLFEDFMRKL